MGTRQLGIYTRPLAGQSVKFLAFSHSAVVVGDVELMLEVIPDAGETALKPVNTLVITRGREDVETRLQNFTLFRERTTGWDDTAIVDYAKEIVERNPIYNFFTWNCHVFTENLMNMIMDPKWHDYLRMPIKALLRRRRDAGEPITDAESGDAKSAFVELGIIAEAEISDDQAKEEAEQKYYASLRGESFDHGGVLNAYSTL